MSTAPVTRSGAVAASRAVITPPRDTPATTARPVPVASITARTSAACSANVYAAGSVGRSARPLPRPSTVTTRYRRASTGLWAFQCRLWAMAQVGVRTTVGLWSAPWTSYPTVTPPRVTEPLRSGRRARIPGLLEALELTVDHVEQRAVTGVDTGQPLEHDAFVEGDDQGHDSPGRVELGVDPQLREAGRERPLEDVDPLLVDPLQAVPDALVVPGDRLQFEVDLVIARLAVLVEEPHGLPPLLDERDVARVHRALPLDEPVREALHHPQQEVLHRAEVVVDEPVVDPGPLSEPAHGDARMAHLDEQGLRGIEQRLGGLGAGRGRRRRHGAMVRSRRVSADAPAPC